MKHEEMKQFAEHLRTVDPAEFNMASWETCLAAHASRFANTVNRHERTMDHIFLVSPEDSVAMTKPYCDRMSNVLSKEYMAAMRKITPEDAYAMLTQYLETGKVKWKEPAL